MLSLEIVFEPKCFPSSDEVWDLLVESKIELHEKKVIDEFTGNAFLFKDYSKFLKKIGSEYFSVKLDNGHIHYSGVGSKGVRLSRLDIENIVVDENDASSWLHIVLRQTSFVQARLFNQNYDFWQNATAVSQYESAGKSIVSLPMISNGLPFPLEEKIVDKSSNPGRKYLNIGYIESVGSVMWLGRPFWGYADTVKCLVEKQNDWLEIEEISDKVLKIKAASEPFSSHLGVQGELQNRLRALLFRK